MLVFKAGDAFANKLFTPFMMDVGFSKTEIAAGGQGAVHRERDRRRRCSAACSMVRLGLLRSMLVFGVLGGDQQPALLRARAWPARAIRSWPRRSVVEHVAGAMGDIALVALIMALCDARYSAFQYALLSALALLPRYSLGYPAGWIADHGGWYLYYVASFIIALPGLALVWWNRRPIEALDRRRGDRDGARPTVIDLERVICRVAELDDARRARFHHRAR